MGIVIVAALAAIAEGLPPVAAITVTWRRTRSAASAGNRSFRPSAQRYAASATTRSRREFMKAPVPASSAPAPRWTKTCKGHLDVAVAAGIENDELLPNCLRGGLHVSSLRLGIRTVRVHEHGNRALVVEASYLASLRTWGSASPTQVLACVRRVRIS
jgi:hypothetical protein